MVDIKGSKPAKTKPALSDLWAIFFSPSVGARFMNRSTLHHLRNEGLEARDSEYFVAVSRLNEACK
jgi:hypothetical protein